MQRYIVTRVFHSFIALIAISMIVFGLARITGNPLDVLLPDEATAPFRAGVARRLLPRNPSVNPLQCWPWGVGAC